MHKNFLNILFLIFLFIYALPVYSKKIDINEFNSKDLSNYFSAIISYDNQKNEEALRFFNLSKPLIENHSPYLKQYVFSLVMEGMANKAIKELENNYGNKNSHFFEAYLILTLNSITKKSYTETKKYLNQLYNFKDQGYVESAIYEILNNYAYLFENKKISPKNENLGNISMITKAFENCYLNNENGQIYFENLINDDGIDFSRYTFFYINYLLENNRFDYAKQLTEQIDILNSTLLITQTKNWVNKKEIRKISQIFSCKNEADILSEFVFLLSNLYASQEEIEKSNFYLNISIFLNPKFKYNLSLLAENYFEIKNYKKTEKILNKFNNNDGIYYWYKLKKKAQILKKEKGEDQSFNFINSKVKKIKNPSTKVLFDMGNIMKSFKKYKLSIDYYNQVISKIDLNSESYADVLYRRGGSYERLKEYKKSDQDLLKSLEIVPDDAYVLNYLAYSWLERNYKIDTAIEMLEEAYKQEQNDPYIIDSIAWAYYLINDFLKAEKFMRRAVELMPNDPIVNDHYGDILWMLDRKIQAKYYWKSVLSLKEVQENMKKDINIKLLKGLNNI